MPNLTVYVPRDLADSLKRTDVNVSRVCQVALRRKVRIIDRGYPADIGNRKCDDPGDHFTRDPQSVA